MAQVDIHYFNQALECVVRRGIAKEQVLKQLGVSLVAEQQQVDTKQMTDLVQYVWAHLNDEFMGCTPNRCKTGVFPFMARHVLNFSHLGQMLEQGFSFYNLVTDDIKMKLVKRGDTAEIEFYFSEPNCDVNHFFMEFWLIIWHRFSSWLIDVKIPLSHVSFTHAKPRHWREIKLLFRCRHHFNRPQVKLSFSAKYLDFPCVRSQSQLSHFLRHSPADLITVPGSEQSYSAKIRAVIANNEQKTLYCPLFETIAAQLDIGPQTLRRQLKIEGTSYPQIKDQIRHDLALGYLRDRRFTIAQTAILLGYSEPRSFTRAFKHWTGISPSKHQKIVQQNSNND